jgi:hypothetical protein
MATVTISIFRVHRTGIRRRRSSFARPYGHARGGPGCIPTPPIGWGRRSCQRRIKSDKRGTHTMPDTLLRAARCHERAAGCIKLANASFDQPAEVRYRLLAERYTKLAECEEARGGARSKYC